MKQHHILVSAIIYLISMTLIGCSSSTTWPVDPEQVYQYLGQESCAQCHSEINTEYAQQAHGLDFRLAHDEDLIGGNGGECAPCHTVGFGESSGYNPDGSTPQLEGIGCEECHGMGNLHAAAPSYTNINRVPNSEDTCWICHVPDFHGSDFQVIELDVGAVTDADLRDEDPDATVHHPQTPMLLGTYGYNRTGEPGAHRLVENTCATCHLDSSDQDHVDHGAEALEIDYIACGPCHGEEGGAKSHFAALEQIITADLIELGGEDPENPGHPDPDAGGGWLAMYAEEKAINLDANDNPDDPAVITYKAARHNYSFVLADASSGAHNPKFAENLLADARELLPIFSIPPQPEPLVYAGSDACQSCHSGIYVDFLESGHSYKLTKVVGGTPPTFPFSTVPNTPAGYTWDDVSYVIGGFAWKARFIDLQGYIITGTDVQWNLETEAWAAYHSDEEVGTKPYDCGACHTTGWVATGVDGPHQDDLPGMYGTFSEPGIWCEACHGMGSHHVQTMSADEIIIDTSSELCGSCHFRDSQHRIAASGGFIRHHEQYDEMIAGPHVVLTCLSCHDQHLSTKYDGSGIIAVCESCHADKVDNNNHNIIPTCIDCHMAKATKSAVAEHEYEGDVRTHIFAINPAAVGKDAMWYEEDGGTFANGSVTLDFACLSCHKDELGVGGIFSEQTLAELSALATGIHD